MSADSEPKSADRLEQALALFLEHAEAGGGDAARLLEQHAELRDLLEPMLGAGGEGVAAPNESEAAVLGDYRLVREIGRGGMGIVYEAWQRSLDRPVALKVLAPALMANPSAVARFRREAAAIGKLRHPGIVEVHGFGNDGDRHWFAMGLIDGEPLMRCRERFAEPESAVRLVAQVLDALQHAHAAGLVHRDVKPGNVLVRSDDSAVLTDFGLAHDEELPSVTTDGSFLGTLDYASPEQVQGGAIDPRTDVWSVGVMLYELLAGRRPFLRGSATATMKAILAEEPVALRRLCPQVSQDLAAILGCALQKEPARRYPTARAFLADLRAWQSGGVVSARAPGATERLLRWVRREPWRATTAGVLVALLPVATGLVVYLWVNAPRIAAAAAAEVRQQREDLLTTAWLALAEEDVAPGLRALEQLPAGDAGIEAPIARAALLARAGRRDEAAAQLQQWTTEPVARHVLAIILDRDSEPSFDIATAVPQSAIESFVFGLLAYEQVHVHHKSTDLYQPAAKHLGVAVAMAEQPRAAFLFWWMVTAARARDAAAFTAAFRAYEQHFHGSQGFRSACVLCASMLPLERGLQILGTVDLVREPKANLALGVLLERAGRAAESEQAYRKGLAADPGNVAGWLQLTGLCDSQKQYVAAAYAARKATELAPNQAEGWSRLGTSLLQADDQVGARAALTRAIELSPGAWRPHFNLGLLQRDAGDDEVALASFRRAAELAPTQPEPHAMQARVLRRLSRSQEAVFEDLRSLHCAPGDWRQWMVVGIGLSDLGLHQVALVHAARATELDPQQATAWSRLAEVLLAQPTVDVVRALQAARRGDELAKGKDSRGVWLLARAEAQNGEVAAAIQRLEALLAGPPALGVSLRKLVEAELGRLQAAK